MPEFLPWLTAGLVVLVAVIPLLVRRRAPFSGYVNQAAGWTRRQRRLGRADLDQEGLLAGFKLEERETLFFGVWEQCWMDGHRIAIQRGHGRLLIWIGNFNPNAERLTRTYLVRTSTERPLPPAGHARRLDAIVGPEGDSLSAEYFLAAGGIDCPELRVPGIRDALPRLTDAVDEVQIFEEPGLQLALDPDYGDVTPSSIDADLRTALRILQALEETQRPPSRTNGSSPPLAFHPA